ncbi:Dolichol kinase EVAN [Chlorella vulgaris]
MMAWSAQRVLFHYLDPMPPSRALAEAIVVAITSATLVAALLLTSWPDDPKWGAFNLRESSTVASIIACITLDGLFEEAEGMGPDLQALQRQAGSSGLALGALALPWTFAGLAIQQHKHGGHPAAAAAMRTAFAASYASFSSIVLLQLVRLRNVQGDPARPQAALWPQLRLPGEVAEVLARLRLPDFQPTQQAVAIVAVATLMSFMSDRQWAALLAALPIAAAAGAPYILLRLLPRVFTVGEALVAGQSTVLLGASALRQLLRRADTVAEAEPFRRFVLLLTAGSVLAAGTTITLLLRWKPALGSMAVQQQMRTRRRSSSSTRAGATNSKAWAAAACATAATAAAAALPAAAWAIRFAVSTRRRTLLCGWWAANLAAALPAQHWINSSGRVPPILVRKGYHLLAVSLFLPALLLEPHLLAVALAAAFALLLALEVLRLSGLPVVGLLLITHFTLLLGMAAPIWLSNALDSAPEAAAGSSTPHAVWPAAHAGIFVIGLGDTAASAVGSLVGRRPICRGSRKTVEGTAAAAGATLLGWSLLAAAQHAAAESGGGGAGVAWLGSLPLGLMGWAGLCAATVLSCLLEATTLQLDNVFVPLQYFALLCLL